MTGIETAAAAGAAAGASSTAAASAGAAAAGAASTGAASAGAVAATNAAVYGMGAEGLAATMAMQSTTASFLSSVTMFDALMLGSTALSSVGGLMGGMQQAAHQENMFEYNSAIESLEAAKREEQRQRLLGETLASQRVMFGAAGLDVTSGSPVRVAEETVLQAERETNIDRDMAQINSMGAAMKRKSASSSMTASTLGVMGGAGEGVMDWWLTRKRLG